MRWGGWGSYFLIYISPFSAVNILLFYRDKYFPQIAECQKAPLIEGRVGSSRQMHWEVGCVVGNADSNHSCFFLMASQKPSWAPTVSARTRGSLDIPSLALCTPSPSPAEPSCQCSKTATSLVAPCPPWTSRTYAGHQVASYVFTLLCLPSEGGSLVFKHFPWQTP